MSEPVSHKVSELLSELASQSFLGGKLITIKCSLNIWQLQCQLQSIKQSINELINFYLTRTQNYENKS